MLIQIIHPEQNKYIYIIYDTNIYIYIVNPYRCILPSMSPFATRSCRSTCQQHVPLSTSAQDSPRRAGRVTVACCHRPERGRSCRARGSFRYLWPAGLCSSSRFETWDVLPFVVGEKDRLQVLGKPLPVLIWDLSNHTGSGATVTKDGRIRGGHQSHHAWSLWWVWKFDRQCEQPACSSGPDVWP